MKKLLIILPFFVVIIICMTSLVMANEIEDVSYEVLFFEDFSEYEIGENAKEWDSEDRGKNYVNIVADVEASEGKALRLMGDEDNPTRGEIVIPFSGTAARLIFQYDTKVKHLAGHNNHYIYAQPHGIDGQINWRLWGGPRLAWAFNYGGYTVVGSDDFGGTNVWNTIRVEVDLENNLADLYFNDMKIPVKFGILVREDFAPVEEIEGYVIRFRLGGVEKGEQAENYYDNILLKVVK